MIMFIDEPMMVHSRKFAITLLMITEFFAMMFFTCASRSLCHDDDVDDDDDEDGMMMTGDAHSEGCWVMQSQALDQSGQQGILANPNQVQSPVSLFPCSFTSVKLSIACGYHPPSLALVSHPECARCVSGAFIQVWQGRAWMRS